MPEGNQTPFDPTDHLLTEGKRPHGAVGPTAGIIIILVLLILGAFYAWGQYLNQQNKVDNLPLIPGNSSAPTGE